MPVTRTTAIHLAPKDFPDRTITAQEWFPTNYDPNSSFIVFEHWSSPDRCVVTRQDAILFAQAILALCTEDGDACGPSC